MSGRLRAYDGDDARDRAERRRARPSARRRAGRARNAPRLRLPISCASPWRSATALSTPLTNRPESSVEKRFASSTASLIATACGRFGTTAQLEGRHAQQQTIDGRQTFDRPAFQQRAHDAVGFVGVVERAEDESLRRTRGTRLGSSPTISRSASRGSRAADDDRVEHLQAPARARPGETSSRRRLSDPAVGEHTLPE